MNAVTRKSGRTTVIGRGAIRPFTPGPSLAPVSGIVSSASATADRRYEPAARSAGRLTTTLAATLVAARRPAMSLKPTPMPSPGVALGTGPMNRLMRNGPAGAIPALRTVNDTLIGRPVDADAGTATAAICRSTKSPISIGTAMVLFASLLSSSWSSASARAMRNFAPTPTVVGIASVGAAAKLTPGASAATGTPGVSSTAAPSSSASSER